MNLFIMNDWKLTLEPQVWGLLPFKKLLDRDKTKEKVRANAEMLFIWYFTDVRSDFLFMPEEERIVEIVKNIPELGEKWKPDAVVLAAIDFYRETSETVIQRLYRQSIKAAQDVGNYLEETEKLLHDVDNSGKPIYKVRDITSGLKDVKFIMRDLKEAEKEVIKEIKDNEGRSKGAQKFNMFEQGL